MRSSFRRRFVPLLAAVPLAFIPAAAAGASGATASGTTAANTVAAGSTPSGTPMHARITNHQILGTSSNASTTPAAPSSPSTLPSKQDQIKVLTAALNTMQANYSKFASFSPGPQDIFDYGIGNLWKQGIDGAGTTIAVVEGWDLPSIAAQVHSFDQNFGLPDPDIETVYPTGPLPATCPPGMVKLGSYGSCSAWGGELALDVITAHLIAPYAKIIISATPADTEETDDAVSQVAMPELMKAVEYIAQNHLANTISISDGSGESTYSSQEEITAQNAGELTAAAAGIPLLVATGDCGVVQNLTNASGQCGNVSQGPDTAAWDDSPWVTAVGGSVPNVSATDGSKLGPDPVWHEGPFSEGAGYSSVYTRPSYQNGVAHITQSPMRSVPDITTDAQDGTSEAAPLLNGVLALATQVNHGNNVGPINPLLYSVLGPRGAKAGIEDVVSGNNSATNVPGFSAAKGFDVATGWGTINAATFVPSLVAATKANGQDAATRHQAASALAQLEHGVQLSATGAGGSEYLLAGGFLPGHPVHLTVDGQAVATLTATPLGTVTDMIDPTTLNLPAGTHQVELSSLLITQTATFRT
ncbi:MAG TPA: S53 family peptidase, partial [Streptosporangiaceae bacterium]|nr:S53 family peptidase [Streptosporangiaceae bacterium]